MPGFAVMDTWTKGSGEWSQWVKAYSNGQISSFTQEYFDSTGAEWWPWVGGVFSQGGFHWQVQNAYCFELVPEPTTILLFSIGSLILRRKRRK